MSQTYTDSLTIPLWGYKTALDYESAIHAHCEARNMEIEEFFKKAIERQVSEKPASTPKSPREFVPISNEPSADVKDRLARNARRYSMIARTILADLREHQGSVAESRSQLAKKFAINQKQLKGILHALWQAKCIDACEDQHRIILRLLPQQDVNLLKLFEQLS